MKIQAPSAFFMLVLLSLSSSALAAGICGDFAVENAQEAVTRVLARESYGAAGTYDVLVAQKNLYEAQFCRDSSDFGSFLALARNVGARLNAVTQSYELGIATSENVAMVRSEKQGLAGACGASLLALAKKRCDQGLLASAELKNAQSACALLSQ